MLYGFFTLIIIAEILLTIKIVLVLNRYNEKVLAVNEIVVSENKRLKQDLKKLRNSMLEACIKTTDLVCSAYKLPQRVSKNIALSIGKKALITLLKVDLEKLLSTLGVVFAIKKFLKSS